MAFDRSISSDAELEVLEKIAKLFETTSTDVVFLYICVEIQYFEWCSDFWEGTKLNVGIS